ncbi:VWA domain-containing protein [Porticoccus sp. GXU_MW_L64]
MAGELESRWRLVLGRFANKNLSDESLSKTQRAQDKVLEQLYKKRLEGRGMNASGTLDDTQLQVVDWLSKTDRLFPTKVREKIQAHAVEEFGIKEVLKNKQALQQLEPSLALLKQLLSIRTELSPELLQEVRRIIRQVVDELYAKLKPVFDRKISGRLNRHQSSPLPVMANLDWKKTIRHNLKHYDLERRMLMIQRVFFSARNQRHIPWRVVLCIDQSGSMMDSIIYSAIIAGILAKLPSVDFKLVLFDTSVVDLSDQADDPVEVLLATQMGGGTHIKKAWQYCESLAEQPSRTIVATVSDFEEGASPAELIGQGKSMIESGIKMLGITALTADSEPFYNTTMTARLSAVGMSVASLSPDTFADWLAKEMEI